MNNFYNYYNTRMDSDEMLSTLELQNSLNYSKENNSNKIKLYDSYEGYIKGNLFKEIYSQYKNYNSSKIVPNSEEEELLLNIQKLQFSMHDINLYLDVYPENKKLIQLFQEYKKKYESLVLEYQKNFNTIDVLNSLDNIPFSWENQKFPWDGGEF